MPVAAGAEDAAVPGHADERRETAPEPQRTLFSWEECMAEETAKPRDPRRTEAPTLSLFGWALEQEQWAALAGATR